MVGVCVCRRTVRRKMTRGRIAGREVLVVSCHGWVVGGWDLLAGMAHMLVVARAPRTQPKYYSI